MLLFSRRFTMGHRLLSADAGQCATPHGHNETVTVSLRPAQSTPLDGHANMIEPFMRAKARWHGWIDVHVDHALQLSARDPLLPYFQAHERARLGKLLVTPGDPTTEVLACCLMAKLNAFLEADGGRLVCAEITLEETATNAVRFAGDPLTFLPAATVEVPWWRRADMSINEFGTETGLAPSG